MPDRRLFTPSISCVMPAYNEATHLPQVVAEVLACLRGLSAKVEVILIDDGSRDATADVARTLALQHPEVVAVALSRNFGKEAALTAGIDAAQGEVVILMDSDGQHPVSLLPEMLARWRDGHDVVYALRRSRDDQSAMQKNLTGWFYRLVNWKSKVQIPPHAGDFRLMDRRVVEALRRLPERNRFMKGLYAWVGFGGFPIEYDPLPRAAGQSSFGLRGSLSLALTGLVAFSSLPLRVVAWFGLLLALGALGYGAWVVIEYWYWGISVPGYATIVVGMMFLSGIQLLSIGVLAEYVGRIYDEVKQRPAYLVRELTGLGLRGPAGSGASVSTAERVAADPRE